LTPGWRLFLSGFAQRGPSLRRLRRMWPRGRRSGERVARRSAAPAALRRKGEAPAIAARGRRAAQRGVSLTGGRTRHRSSPPVTPHKRSLAERRNGGSCEAGMLPTSNTTTKGFRGPPLDVPMPRPHPPGSNIERARAKRGGRLLAFTRVPPGQPANKLRVRRGGFFFFSDRAVVFDRSAPASTVSRDRLRLPARPPSVRGRRSASTCSLVARRPTVPVASPRFEAGRPRQDCRRRTGADRQGALVRSADPAGPHPRASTNVARAAAEEIPRALLQTSTRTLENKPFEEPTGGTRLPRGPKTGDAKRRRRREGLEGEVPRRLPGPFRGPPPRRSPHPSPPPFERARFLGGSDA